MIRREVMVGKPVYGLFFGKICRGEIIAIYNQTLDAMEPGTKYRNGFKVKWDYRNLARNLVSQIHTIAEYQASELFESVFFTKEEVASYAKSMVSEKNEIQLETCRDFYGLALKVGDYVKPIAKGRFAVSGCIREIYKKVESSKVYLKLVDAEGNYIAVEEDPRNYTTAIRKERKTNQQHEMMSA